ncbi:MAG TPA: MoaD/ThiS family protein [Planctomycetota bacterium]|nr:MoaD/ThiS family protein [Planctomycetota bacterium]
MKVVVQLFGSLAEQAGRSRLDVTVDAATVEAVVDAAARDAKIRIDPSVRFAVNTDYAAPDAAVRDGDVVSLLPPVGGG